tara:strand:+ start:1949 stop:2245 length:297 start_codon:yes stop_codon:yes gene_type:complete
MQLYEESTEADSKYPLLDIKEQLPFFCCINLVLNPSDQKDISKYIYCKEVGIPPHQGEYSTQPSLWVEKFWTIKQALNIREYLSAEQAKQKAKQNGSF